MKNRLFILLLILATVIQGQSPSSFNYQAVVRDNSGATISNQIVGVKISIVSGSISGSAVYQESHSIATNNYGLVNIQIGSGTVMTGVFSTIDWGGNTFYIKTELDASGGTSYELMGITQLLSVPYALHAKTAENIDDADADATNEIQSVTKSGTTITLSKNGGDFSINDEDADSTNELQTLNLVGNTLQLSKGNSVTLSGTVDLDADPTNEIQLISNSNDTIFLQNGGYVVLPKDNDADSTNEIQSLSIVSDSIILSSSNKIPFHDNDSTNELQVLSMSNDTLFLSKSNFVIIPPDFDGDSTNEIQQLTISSDSILISNGNKIPFYDNDSINEIQSITVRNDSLIIAKGNGIPLYEIGTGSENGKTLGIKSTSNIDIQVDNLCGVGEIISTSSITNSTIHGNTCFEIDNSGNQIISITTSEKWTNDNDTTTNSSSVDIGVIIKKDNSCKTIWRKDIIGATSSGEIKIHSLKSNNDTLYVLGYNTGINRTLDIVTLLANNFFILKIDPSGTIVAQESFPTSNLYNYTAGNNEFEIDSKGNIYVIYRSTTSYLDIYKYDSNLSNGTLFYRGSGSYGRYAYDFDLQFQNDSVLYTTYASGAYGYPFILKITNGANGVYHPISAGYTSGKHPEIITKDSTLSLFTSYPLKSNFNPDFSENWSSQNSAQISGLLIQDLILLGTDHFVSYTNFPLTSSSYFSTIDIEPAERNTIYLAKIDSSGATSDFRSVGNNTPFYGGYLRSFNSDCKVLFYSPNSFKSLGKTYSQGFYVGKIF